MTESIFTAVRTAFLADWPALEPNVELIFDGEGDDKDEDATQSAEPWVWVGLFPVDRDFAALGGAEIRNEGFVWIRCYTEDGTGATRAWELARKAGSVLENKLIGGIRFRTARPDRQGSEDVYYRVDSLVDYVSEEITT